MNPAPWRIAPRWATILVLLLLASFSGCASISARPTPLRNVSRDYADRVSSQIQLSQPTRFFLHERSERLSARLHPIETVLRLEAEQASRPDPASALAIAELWYRRGLTATRQDCTQALVAYRDAAAAASIAIVESAGCLDRAIEIHNEALARIFRIARYRAEDEGGLWSNVLAEAGIVVNGSSPFVEPSRFQTVLVSKDYRTHGLRHHFGSDGLGLPVTGIRHGNREHPSEPDEAFFPKILTVGATVLARSGGTIADGSYRTAPMTLQFHDPFGPRTVSTGRTTLPLATDRSTQLALQTGSGLLELQAFVGLLTSSFQREIEPGLYMVRQYQPGKIPVVFVHGLVSSPLAFIQTVNEFRNDPILSQRYQFWVFAYPTGRSIPRSAQLLRESLAKAEKAYGSDPAFHQMVLAGHSMGAVLTHMMVSESGRTVWDGALSVPPEQLKASPTTREALDKMLFFKPVPCVKRAIFIAGPHQGSSLANQALGRVVGRMIDPPNEQLALINELNATNGRNVFHDENFQGRGINAIGNLRVDSPLLKAVQRLPIDPGVPYHSIIFLAGGHTQGDLIVPYWSAHLEGAASEIVLPGTHFSEQEPATCEEIRRILLEHIGMSDPVVVQPAQIPEMSQNGLKLPGPPVERR